MTTNTIFHASLALPLLVVIGIGCDKEKPQTVATPPAPSSQPKVVDWDKMSADFARDLPGKWEAWVGTPADGFYSHMTLEARPDRTFALTNVMPEPGRPGATIENVSDGRWHMDRDVVVLDVEHISGGRPIREDQKHLRLGCFGNDDPEHLKITYLFKPGATGPRFDRAGTAMHPTPIPVAPTASAPAQR